MPFRFEEATTPGNRPLLRVFAGGEVALADAEALDARLAPGGPNHRWHVLTTIARGTEYAPAARKRFPSLHGNYVAMAAVVSSSIVRAAINMMMRLTGQAPNFRMFSREDEALAWLDGFSG